ncbi:hypothetical protein M404DRAFT_1002872 [Pisolithus tinctorius Marx 270]|uniref:Uncharacterized protein n=1 Tax=Pisolithus tinctorius Marx 270 TaxID=870435 RepID=A0A0C3P2N4_PISTI|nr:hypothetical protein M404DRAFT_1002872 [Pisolithus tinctorius Marx 270]
MDILVNLLHLQIPTASYWAGFKSSILASFHIVSFFSLHIRDRAWVKSWQERQFSVGGPKPLMRKGHITEEAFDAVHCLAEEGERSRKNERHVAAARSEWAMSQVEAEDYYLKYT